MRAVIRQLPGSKIREVANAGLSRSDVLAFWFGESDEPTPEFVRAAAVESLARGETFYSHNLGLPELREAIACYTSGLHREVPAARVAVTSAGVNALMIAMQVLVDAGDEVVVVVPVWPNLPAQPAILGARVTRFALEVRDGAWRLDLQALLGTVTERTRVLLVNSPNNPSGQVYSRDVLKKMGELVREKEKEYKREIFFISDDAYRKIVFDGLEVPYIFEFHPRSMMATCL